MKYHVNRLTPIRSYIGTKKNRIVVMVFTSQDYLAIGVITIVTVMMCLAVYDRCRRSIMI